MKKIFVIFLFIFLSAISVQGQTSTTDVDDIQLWPDLTVSLTLTKKTSLNFFGTIRWGDDLQRIISEQGGIAYNIRANKNWSFTSHYRAIWSQPEVNRHSFEHRLFQDVTPRLSLGRGVNLTDRNRIEWRKINGNNSWRYRNRVQLERTLKIHEHQLTPYLSAEIHYDSRYEIWNRKQYWAGLRVPLTKHWSWDLFYSQNNDQRGRQRRWDVVGLFTRLEF